MKKKSKKIWDMKKLLKFKQVNRRKKHPRGNPSGSNKDWKARSRWVLTIEHGVNQGKEF